MLFSCGRGTYVCTEGSKSGWHSKPRPQTEPRPLQNNIWRSGCPRLRWLKTEKLDPSVQSWAVPKRLTCVMWTFVIQNKIIKSKSLNQLKLHAELHSNLSSVMNISNVIVHWALSTVQDTDDLHLILCLRASCVDSLSTGAFALLMCRSRSLCRQSFTLSLILVNFGCTFSAVLVQQAC